MCGINGIYKFNDFNREDELHSIITKMNEKLIHRGPDDDGIFVNSKVAFGMRRLSIIDLNHGHQPIFNDDHSKLIIFNGEIYNYQSLKKRLMSENVIFQTESDTEVILKAYETYGTNAIEMFHGMFAFAIYDKNEHSMIIARDRAGEKPLYYYHNNDTFMFSSELKSLKEYIPNHLNLQALQSFFMLSYIPSPQTIYQDVYKLEPGCYLEIKNQNVTINRYWTYKIDANADSRLDEDALNNTRDVFKKAFKETMVSDVPIGAFLSGGIDSGITVGLMSQFVDEPINTFTVAFNDKRYDEKKLASLTALKHQTNHSIKHLDYQDIYTEIESIITQFDEPFADDSALATFFVSKHASQSVKVCLTGDGSDELFAGYEKYKSLHYSQIYRKIPRLIRKTFETVFQNVPKKYNLTRKITKVIQNASLSPFEMHLNLMSMGFNQSELKELFLPQIYSQFSNEIMEKTKYLYYRDPDLSEIERSLIVDFNIALEGSMLAKVDRMSMHNSLETRSPFLHPLMIEQASQIHIKNKIVKRKSKIILKKIFKEIIPKRVLRGKKRGFSLPIDTWIRSKLFKEIKEFYCEGNEPINRIFSSDYVQHLISEHLSLKLNHARKLWALYVFKIWYKNNIGLIIEND